MVCFGIFWSGQLLINTWRIINTFVTKFNVLNRVFCRFNRLCGPCRTTVITLLVVTPQIHTQGHMPNKQSIRTMLVKKLLVNNWRIMNNFVTKLSVEDRVFCPFNRLCVPCGTRDITFLFLVTPQIHTRRHMPIIFYNNHLPVNYSSINGAS